MKTLTDHLAQYAAYHRDTRNIVTHFIGIPMIVVAVAALLARWELFFFVTFADVVFAGACYFYWRLSKGFGIAMFLIMGSLLWTGHAIAALSETAWWVIGVGLFILGWFIQFVGHYYEKRKPAFVDDIVGLLVGPLFLVAEAAFALGMQEPLRREIEARVGPTLVKA